MTSGPEHFAGNRLCVWLQQLGGVFRNQRFDMPHNLNPRPMYSGGANMLPRVKVHNWYMNQWATGYTPRGLFSV